MHSRSGPVIASGYVTYLKKETSLLFSILRQIVDSNKKINTNLIIICPIVWPMVRVVRDQKRAGCAQCPQSTVGNQSIVSFSVARLERTGQQRIGCHRVPVGNGTPSTGVQEFECWFVERRCRNGGIGSPNQQRGRTSRLGPFDFHAVS